MNITPSHPGREELAGLLPGPAERDLPSGRHQAIKTFLMDEVREAPVSERKVRRGWRRPAALVPALTAATALTVGLTVTLGQAPAYAVAKNPDGTITIEIRRWDDAKKLQADLREMGVSVVVDFVPGGKRCRPGRVADPVPREQYRHSLLNFAEDHRVSEGFVTKLDPSAIKTGQTAVLEYYHPKDAGGAFNGWVANGAVAPCVLEDAAEPW
ncbi:hypothetical protein OHR68_01715 [Spirillospora sp. NBC_00431]